MGSDDKWGARMLWNALNALLTIAGVLGAAFIALWVMRLALRDNGKVRIVAFLAAVLWLLIFVRWLVQLVQSGV